MMYIKNASRKIKDKFKKHQGDIVLASLTFAVFAAGFIFGAITIWIA